MNDLPSHLLQGFLLKSHWSYKCHFLQPDLTCSSISWPLQDQPEANLKQNDSVDELKNSMIFVAIRISGLHDQMEEISWNRTKVIKNHEGKKEKLGGQSRIPEIRTLGVSEEEKQMEEGQWFNDSYSRIAIVAFAYRWPHTWWDIICTLPCTLHTNLISPVFTDWPPGGADLLWCLVKEKMSQLPDN